MNWWVVVGTGSLGLTMGWLVCLFVHRAPKLELTAISTLAAIIGGDAPDFVEVGEAGIAMDDATRRQRRVQLVG
jgi:hypothetical protein